MIDYLVLSKHWKHNSSKNVIEVEVEDDDKMIKSRVKSKDKQESKWLVEDVINESEPSNHRNHDSCENVEDDDKRFDEVEEDEAESRNEEDSKRLVNELEPSKHR